MEGKLRVMVGVGGMSSNANTALARAELVNIFRSEENVPNEKLTEV